MYTIQLAAYDTRPPAEQLVRKLATRGVKARVSGTAKPFRVRLDFYRTSQEAASIVTALKARGIIGFVTQETPPRGSLRRDRVGGDTAHAAVSGDQSAAPERNLVLSDGRLLRMFYEDAETAARVLGLTLTARNNGGAAEVPLAGVPVKAGPEYLRRLVQQGYRVAICEQVEDSKLAKGIVRRDVIETVSPGVVFADDLLDGARNNFIVALMPPARGHHMVGIAAADVSTGELRLCSAPFAELDALLARFAPRELLLPRGSDALARTPTLDGVLVTEREPWEFDEPTAREDLARQYNVRGLDGLGIGSDDAAALSAAGALLRYLKEMQPGGVPHLSRPILSAPAAPCRSTR